MDKKTYEYMKDRVNAFQLKSDRILILEKKKASLDEYTVDNHTDIVLYNNNRRWEFRVTPEKYKAIKNTIINEIDSEINELRKEIEEI